MTASRIFALLLFLCAFVKAPAQSIDTLFARVPRSVLPLLDNTAKLDLLDLYNNHLTAKAENTLGGQAELLEKKADALLLRTSDAGTWQMKLLPAGHDTLICCIYSVKAGGTSSKVAIYQRNWHRSKHNPPHPTFELFYNEKNTLSSVRAQSVQNTLRQLPVEAAWSDSAQALVFKLSLDSLCKEDEEDARKCVREVKYLWQNGLFTLQQ